MSGVRDRIGTRARPAFLRAYSCGRRGGTVIMVVIVTVVMVVVVGMMDIVLQNLLSEKLTIQLKTVHETIFSIHYTFHACSEESFFLRVIILLIFRELKFGRSNILE